MSEYFDFEGLDLNSFLDGCGGASPEPGGGRSVVPSMPSGEPFILLQNILLGKHHFIDNNGFAPYAVLMNPVDKFRVQQWVQEGTDVDFFEHPEAAPDTAFKMMLQPATWIDEGMYQIISERDYMRLVAHQCSNE